jgi:uncharacterized RDD family membrane protein YckC
MRLNPFAINANLLKRTGAVVFDLFLWIVGSLLLLRYVFAPLYEIDYGMSQLSNQSNSFLVASYLYKNYEGTNQIINVELEDYPESIYNYYSIFKDGKVFEAGEAPFEFTIAWYNTTILEVEETTSLFELVGGDINVVALLKDNVENIDRDEFYTDAYRDALIDLVTYPPISALISLINRYSLEMISYSTVISFFTFYLAIPIALKKGQTLGKKATSLMVVNDKGYVMKWWQLPIRSIVFGWTLFSGLFLPIPLPPITTIFACFATILLSYTLMAFTKFFRSGNDFVASTRIVDKKSSLIFKDEQALRAYEYRLETGKVLGQEKR